MKTSFITDKARQSRRWRLVFIMCVEVAIFFMLVVALTASDTIEEPLQSDTSPDSEDVWILDRVWIDGEEQEVPVVITSISAGGTFKSDWDGTTESKKVLSGVMNFSYPERLSSAEEAVFMIDGANATYSWDLGPNYRTGTAKIEAEFYDFYRPFGKNYCEKEEKDSIAGGNQGSATLQLGSFGCTYDPTDRYFDDWDTLKFVSGLF